MQQHTVPQNITGFEFKLIGALTIKQFGYVATAGVLSFIIFIAIGGFIRWVLIAPIVSTGIALAFANISGMTFDKWLVAFIRAVTSPPQRIWRKEPKTLSFLSPEFSYYLKRPPAAIVQNQDKTALKSYLAQLKKGEKIDKLDKLEITRLASLNFFGSAGRPNGEEGFGTANFSSQTDTLSAAVPPTSPVVRSPRLKSGSENKINEVLETTGSVPEVQEGGKDKDGFL